MEYKLIPLSKKYLRSFENLIKISFPLQSTNVRKLVEWKFLTCHAHRKAVSYVAVSQSGQVVSQYSNIPITISQEKNLYKGMVCADMATLSDHRGQGLISNLSKRVYEKVSKNSDISIGSSNALGVQVDRNSSAYGYHIIGEFTQYIKFIFRPKDSVVTLVKISDFDQDFIPQSDLHFQIYKNYEYLHWRYVAKPENSYQLFRLEISGRHVGYTVLVIQKMRVYVYEILTKDGEGVNARFILKALENYAYKLGCYLLVYRVLDSSYWSTLFSKGRYIQRSPKKIKYYFTVKIHNQELQKKHIFENDNWIIGNGDIY